MPNIWWCNQGQCWKCERRNGVVCSSTVATNLTFRRTAGEVKKGDIIVHYVKGFIVAISKAEEDGKEIKNFKLPNCNCEYGGAWTFKTNYYDLKEPISRNSISEDIFKLKFPKSPIIFYPTSNEYKVRQAYFIPFDKLGLEVIIKKASNKENFPDWLK